MVNQATDLTLPLIGNLKTFMLTQQSQWGGDLLQLQPLLSLPARSKASYSKMLGIMSAYREEVLNGSSEICWSF